MTLAGAIAHKLADIKSRDTLMMTITDTIASGAVAAAEKDLRLPRAGLPPLLPRQQS
jgi:hypothetical protein